MFDSIEFDPFSDLRLSKFWQTVCGEPSETVVHILVFAVSSVTLSLRTMTLNIFKVSTVGTVIPNATSAVAISIMMLTVATGIANNNDFDRHSIDDPMLYLSKSE